MRNHFRVRIALTIAAIVALAVLLRPVGAGAAPAAPPPPPPTSTTSAESAPPAIEGAWSGTPSAASFPAPSPAVVKRVSSLLELIRHTDAGAERDRLVADLIDVGPDGIPLLLSELDRRSQTTWPAMVYALGALGDPRLIPVLHRELGVQSGPVYMDVLYSLTLAGDPQAPALALRSSYATMSVGADATAMDLIAGALGPAAVPMLIREIPRRAQGARIAGLGALGTICDETATPFLLEWSKQANPVDRRHALMALARIGDPRAGPRLIEGVADGDASVREAAVEGLGYLREARAAPALLKLAADPQGSSLRRRAWWSLALIGGPEATATLTSSLKAATTEEDHSVLIHALGQTNSPDAVAALAQEAVGVNPALAAAAVRGLAASSGADASEPLLTACDTAPVAEAGLEAARTLMQRRDPRAAPCAIKRLRDEIERQHGLDPLGDEILVRLPLAASPSAAASLDVLAENVAAPAVQHRIREAARLTRTVHELGANLDPWIKLLDDGDMAEVDLAIRRLGDLGDSRAVEPLQRLFGRIDPERAWLIPEALGRIGSERGAPFLISLLTDDLYRVPSLVRAREEAARALARFSRSVLGADACRSAFLAERGRLFVTIMAYARMRGPDAIPDLVGLNKILLQRRGRAQILRHEKVNWAIRMLRAGREVPMSEVSDVD